MKYAMIDDLLNKYWEGDSSLEEERLIKEYFAEGNVDEKHLPFAPLFGFFNLERESKVDISLEKALKDAESLSKPIKGRIFRLPRHIFSIAATVALLLCSVFIFNNYNTSISEQSYVAVDGEMQDLQSEEEALAIAQDALLFLSGKLNEGSTTVKDKLVKTKRGKIFK